MARTHWKDAAIAESDEGGPNAARRSLIDRFRGRTRTTQVVPESPGGASVDQASGTDPVADLDDRSFFGALENAALNNNVLVVDFWAPWCGPCKQLHPLFDDRAAEYSAAPLQFGRINVDESPGVASAFQVMSIPTIILIGADGNEIEREIGLPSKRRLDQLVRSAASIADKLTGHGAA